MFSFCVFIDTFPPLAAVVEQPLVLYGSDFGDGQRLARTNVDSAHVGVENVIEERNAGAAFLRDLTP